MKFLYTFLKKHIVNKVSLLFLQFCFSVFVLFIVAKIKMYLFLLQILSSYKIYYIHTKCTCISS